MSRFNEDNVLIVTNPLVQHHLTFMRDKGTPSGRFRQHLKSLTRALFYEAIAEMEDAPRATGQVETTDGKSTTGVFIDSSRYVLIAIMRTGVGMMGAVHDSLEEAAIGHAHYLHNEKNGEIEELAVSLPELSDRFVLIFDSGMKTGRTAAALVEELVKRQHVKAQNIAILTATATQQSIETINAVFGTNNNPIRIVTAAIDKWNDDDPYPDPGMGSMRDRLYGPSSVRLPANRSGENNG